MSFDTERQRCIQKPPPLPSPTLHPYCCTPESQEVSQGFEFRGWFDSTGDSLFPTVILSHILILCLLIRFSKGRLDSVVTCLNRLSALLQIEYICSNCPYVSRKIQQLCFLEKETRFLLFQKLWDVISNCWKPHSVPVKQLCKGLKLPYKPKNKFNIFFQQSVSPFFS